MEENIMDRKRAVNYILRKCTFFLILLCNTNVWAQTEEQLVTIPPSPDAGHLGTYGELAVSKATGSANVSVPIATLQEGGLTVPVTLNYQSAGLRVDGQPSSVGMGWVLNGGGVITRTMRGRCDEMHNGFLTNSMAVPNKTIVDADLITQSRQLPVFEKLRNMLLHGTDYTPDAFAFNFGNYGGSFFFGNEGGVHCTENNGSNMRFEPIFGTDEDIALYPIILGWMAYDSKGLIYEFGRNYDSEGVLSEFDNYETTRVHTDKGWEQEYISSWYIRSITNPIIGTVVEFSYDEGDYQYTDETTTASKTYTRIPEVLQYPWNTDIDYSYSAVYHQRIKFLSSISLNNQTINFNHSSSPSNNYRKLDAIQWNNGSNVIDFNFTYSTSGDRLLLKAISEPHEGDTKEHNFEYYTGELPERKSFGQDHWGYYNGAQNNNLVPEYIYYGLGPQALGGTAIRESSFEHTRRGMLKKITYPTKGTSTFSYEQNTWEDKTNENDVAEIIASASIDATGEGAGTLSCEQSDWIVNTPNQNSTYQLLYSFNLSFDNLENLPEQGKYPYFTIIDYDTQDEVFEYVIKSEVAGSFELTSGHNYSFELCAYGSSAQVTVNMQLEETEESLLDQPIARSIGGLRLSSIENSDPVTTKTQTRTFDYGEGGYKVWNDPAYHRISRSVLGCGGENEFGPRIYQYNLVVSSFSTGGLGPSSLPVAYEKVIEWLGTEFSNTGKIETVYVYAEDDKSFRPHESKHTTRTTVDYENYYNATGTLIQVVDYNYDLKVLGQAIGFHAMQNVYPAGLCVMEQDDWLTDFTYSNFLLNSRRRLLKSKTIEEHTPDGIISNTTTYDYDPDYLHSNPIMQTQSNSNGDMLTTVYTYPIENASSSNDCYIDYGKELDVCDNYVNQYALEAEDCRAAWNGCFAAYTSCEEQYYIAAYATCKTALGAWKMGCLKNLYNDFSCAEGLSECKNSNFNPCIEDLETNHDYEVCQKTTFVNYKVCQSDFYAGLLDDYDNALNPHDKAVALLNINNIQTIPLKVESFNGTEELSSATNTFDTWELNRSGSTDIIPLLQSKSIAYQQASPEQLTTVNKYDNKANPLEVFYNKEGVLKSYLWGYNNTYLVAEIINANYDDVLVALGEEIEWLNGNQPTEEEILTAIDNIRNHPSMNNAQVTTFTYFPGIGLHSKVDPNGNKTTYSYDDMGRLTDVRDDDNNIIKSYEYNYAGE